MSCMIVKEWKLLQTRSPSPTSYDPPGRDRIKGRGGEGESSSYVSECEPGNFLPTTSRLKDKPKI